MGEIVRGIDRERIAALRAGGHFFWVDAVLGETSGEELARTLDIPDHALRPLIEFREERRPSAKFHADSDHVVFPFTCFVESAPVEAHVLVSGGYMLTVHREAISLPDALEPELPGGRSEQFLIYGVLEAMVVTGFERLIEIEDTIQEIQSASTDMRSARIRIDTLRTLTSDLTQLRRRVAPQRGTFARIGDEIRHVRGLELDSESYFDRIGDQINRLVDAIDATADGVGRLIDLRVNETIYWLTVLSTLFLPLTFVTGFFGMNFGWMVRHIDTPGAFLVLGVGGCVLGVVVTVLAIRLRGTPVE